jgi:uncharacterized membrane protein
MDAYVLEWLQLIGRWVHVLAAIMWIGDSFLFMWMDAQLRPASRPRDGDVAGEMWMVHSGGFYEVVKRRVLAPHELPEALHWFKWQAYTTWLSGAFLLVVVYYLGGTAMLVDPSIARLGHGQAVALSVALIAATWLLYDALWSSPLRDRPRLAMTLTVAIVAALTLAMTSWFGGRAAYLLTGAALGTAMAANVWRRIIPSQSQMLAATRAGLAADAMLGMRAKQRSIHNHYATLPVLFTMLGTHFPTLYGHRAAGVVLLLVMVVGVAAKHVMNHRGRSHRGLVAAGVVALIAVVTLTVPRAGRGATAAAATGPPVAFAEVQAILERRCASCHAARPVHPAFPEPPNGVVLEAPETIRALATRIRVRAVETRTMPLGNLTGMTDAERATLGAWVAQGARIQ